MATGSGAHALRGGTSREALSRRGPREPSGGSGSGSGVGGAVKRAVLRGSGTAPPRATASAGIHSPSNSRAFAFSVPTSNWFGTRPAQQIAIVRSRSAGCRAAAPCSTGPCTEENTIDLIRRLAPIYSDDAIAGILNRQGRRSATGERFTAIHVGGLPRYRKIPRYHPPDQPATGELVTIRQAATILGLAPSPLHRCPNDGHITGEQVTPGAPWRIPMNDELRARFVEQAPSDFLPMLETTRKLGVSRQTVLQRVKPGEL
jgi:hypothetical protein